MKVAALLLVSCLVFSVYGSDSLAEIKKIGDDLKNTFTGMGNQLKEVSTALGTVAKEKAKSLASQTLQALAGAFVNSFNNFNLGEMIFGKRELRVPEFIANFAGKIETSLENIFKNTYAKFGAIIKRLSEMRPDGDVKTQVEKIQGEHEMAVRGVLGDTLNAGIDLAKKLYYKVKGYFSGDSDVADPVMVGKRSLVNDAWNSFLEKVNSLKEKIQPHYAKASEVTKNVAAVIGHYGGRMFQQAKDKAVEKMRETLGDLHSNLKEKLSNAKDMFITLKDELADTVQQYVSGY